MENRTRHHAGWRHYLFSFVGNDSKRGRPTIALVYKYTSRRFIDIYHSIRIIIALLCKKKNMHKGTKGTLCCVPGCGNRGKGHLWPKKTRKVNYNKKKSLRNFFVNCLHLRLV